MPGVVSVAALDEKQPHLIADYSNHGELSVDLAASGTFYFDARNNGKLKMLMGTSFAAPAITRKIAEIISSHQLQRPLPRETIYEYLKEYTQKSNTIDVNIGVLKAK